jgi:hypothetical protein
MQPMLQAVFWLRLDSREGVQADACASGDVCTGSRGRRMPGKCRFVTKSKRW